MNGPGTRFSFPAPGHGVYLLDDHELIRLGLRHLLETAGITVLGESASARQAVRRIPALRPQLAILDGNLPDGTGAAVCRTLRAADPYIRCLILADTADEDALITAVLSDAWGCLSKKDDNTEQLRLIRRALAGGTAFSPGFQHLFQQAGTSPQVPQPEGRSLGLSRQETNAAIGLGHGRTNRQIAHDLKVTEKTAKNLVSSVLHKLGMVSRTQAAVFIATSTNWTRGPHSAGYPYIRSPKLTAQVTAALQNCTQESTASVDDATRATAANALAAAFAGNRADPQPRPTTPPARGSGQEAQHAGTGTASANASPGTVGQKPPKVFVR